MGPRESGEYNPEACRERHKTIGEDVADLKDRVGNQEEKVDKHLEKIYGRMDELGRQLLLRLPPWVTIVISILTLALGALAGIHYAAH